MLKEKKLYLILSLLMVFALVGEQPNLKDDIKRTSTRLMRSLHVDEVVDGWQSMLGKAEITYRNLSDRLVNRASAATLPDEAIRHELPIVHRPHSHLEPANTEPKNCQCPWSGVKAKC